MTTEIIATCDTEAEACEIRRVARKAAVAAYKAGTAGASSFKFVARCLQSINSRGRLVETYVIDVVKTTGNKRKSK